MTPKQLHADQSSARDAAMQDTNSTQHPASCTSATSTGGVVLNLSENCLAKSCPYLEAYFQMNSLSWGILRGELYTLHERSGKSSLVKWYQLPAQVLGMQLFYACNVQVLDTGTLYIHYTCTQPIDTGIRGQNAHTLHVKEEHQSELTWCACKHSVMFVSPVHLAWLMSISISPHTIWCLMEQATLKVAPCAQESLHA